MPIRNLCAARRVPQAGSAAYRNRCDDPPRLFSTEKSLGEGGTILCRSRFSQQPECGACPTASTSGSGRSCGPSTGTSNAILKPLRHSMPSKTAVSCNRGAKGFSNARARPRCESEGNAARFIERRDRLVRAASFHRQKTAGNGKARSTAPRAAIASVPRAYSVITCLQRPRPVALDGAVGSPYSQRSRGCSTVR
jgi:hypothetical protein